MVCLESRECAGVGDCFSMTQGNDVEVQTPQANATPWVRALQGTPRGGQEQAMSMIMVSQLLLLLDVIWRRVISQWSARRGRHISSSRRDRLCESANVSSLHVNVAPQLETPASPLSTTLSDR